MHWRIGSLTDHRNDEVPQDAYVHQSILDIRPLYGLPIEHKIVRIYEVSRFLIGH